MSRSSIPEKGVAENSPHRKDGPLVDVVHKSHLTETLYHGVIVHDDGGVELSNSRDRSGDDVGEVEFTALPVPGQVLRASRDEPVRFNFAGAANSNKLRKPDTFLVRTPDETAQHTDQAFDDGVSA